MTAEDPRHALAVGQVADPTAGDRSHASSYQCLCGFATDDTREFDRHLNAIEGTNPEHFEVLAGWTFQQVRQWLAAPGVLGVLVA